MLEKRGSNHVLFSLTQNNTKVNFLAQDGTGFFFFLGVLILLTLKEVLIAHGNGSTPVGVGLGLGAASEIFGVCSMSQNTKEESQCKVPHFKGIPGYCCTLSNKVSDKVLFVYVFCLIFFLNWEPSKEEETTPRVPFG